LEGAQDVPTFQERSLAMIMLSSRGIARRTVLTAIFAACAAALLTTTGCSKSPGGAAGQPAAPVAPPASSTPLVPVAPSGSTSSPPPVAGLPGRLYYADADRLLRLTRSGLDTVLPAGAYSANVSPDGASIAFVDANNDVVVADRNGQHRRTLLRGSVSAGYEPAWSPDSRRLLAAKNLGSGRVTLGVITVATATFTPLPHQLADAIHPLWSADGKHLGYATGTCQLATADPDGANPRIVPVFGDFTNTANPEQRRSCDPSSISPDGRYLAVNQRTGDQPDGDIGRDLTANTIIDTRTGANVSLPVKGTITQILFQPNGDILVRTSTHQLTLLNPDHTVKTQVTEPATTANTRLLAYTPK
jgi:TolB protein